MLKSFEWRLPTTILFGPGKLNEMARSCRASASAA